MAIDFGRKALSKLSGFLSSAKISRCVSPPPPSSTTFRGDGMEVEFENIEQQNEWNQIYSSLRSKSDSGSMPCRAARKEENRRLNRYTDVLPFDHSRVVLTRGDTDFINANTVSYDKAKRTYILTQGPLESTVGHFWLMVWEQSVPVIVMLNKILEKQRIKCHKYWPDDEEEPLQIADLDLLVEFVDRDEKESYVKRTFKLTDTKSKEIRNIEHFQYTEWPDFGIPECPDNFLRFLDLVRQSVSSSSLKGPSIVHCSAGIGRSGTFCLVDVILKMFEEDIVKNNGDIDVQEVLLDLRKCRIGLIQTPDQLKFAYVALIEAFKRRKNAQLINCSSSQITEGKEAMETNEATELRSTPMVESGEILNGELRERNSPCKLEDENMISQTMGQTESRDSSVGTDDSPQLRSQESGVQVRETDIATEPEELPQSEGDERSISISQDIRSSNCDAFVDEDEGSSPQKRAHHRLSANHSDPREEPILKRNKSQDE